MLRAALTARREGGRRQRNASSRLEEVSYAPLKLEKLSPTTKRVDAQLAESPVQGPSTIFAGLMSLP